MTRGQVRVDVAVTGFKGFVEHTASCADDGPEGCADGAATTYTHRVEVPWLRVEPALALGIADGWHVQASLPYDLRVRHVTYMLSDGTPYAPADPGLHHEEGWQTGLTDGRLMVWTGRKEGQISWAWGLGTTVRAGLDGARWGGGLQLDVREPLYANREGYRPPEVISRSFFLSWRATPRLSLLASWERSHQDEERWHGVEHGGMHMYGLAGGALWQVRPSFGLQSRVRYNVAHVAYDTFGDEQIRKPLLLTLAASWEGRGWRAR